MLTFTHFYIMIELSKTNGDDEDASIWIIITAAVGLKHLTSVRCKTKDAPDKGDLVMSEV